MPISSSQFGGVDSVTPDVTPPLSLSASTFGSAAQATTWVNRNLGGEKPMSLSKKTMGTTYKFDDTTGPSLPSSDKGVGRNA